MGHPPMAQLLRTFRAKQYPENEVAPMFSGYLCEHAAFYYPGAQQLAGDSVMSNEQHSLSRRKQFNHLLDK